jgi:hypothetical protein
MPAKNDIERFGMAAQPERNETSIRCLKRQIGTPYERPAILPAWLATRAERRIDRSWHRLFMTAHSSSPFVTGRPLTGLSVPTRE